MRQYRGKRVDVGKWIYGGLIEFKKELYIFDQKTGQSFLGGFRKVIPASVGQSIGRGDDSLAPIWQGDIVQFTGEGGALYEVVYDEECGAFALHNWDSGTHTFFYELSEEDIIKVIGNTTDDPELLKEQS